MELLGRQCRAAWRATWCSGTYREEEEQLGELSLVEEVGQVLHGIVPQHRDVLVLPGVFSPQTTCERFVTQRTPGHAQGMKLVEGAMGEQCVGGLTVYGRRHAAQHKARHGTWASLFGLSMCDIQATRVSSGTITPLSHIAHKLAWSAAELLTYPLPDIRCHLVTDLHADHELVWVDGGKPMAAEERKPG